MELGKGLLLNYLVRILCVLGLSTRICYVAYINPAGDNGLLKRAIRALNPMGTLLTCDLFSLTCTLLIQTFYNAAFKKVQRVTERYRKMEEAYVQVCSLFGENPKVVEPSDFFKNFIDFISNYKVCSCLCRIKGKPVLSN